MTKLSRVLLLCLAGFWGIQINAFAQGVAATTSFAQVNQTSLRYQLMGQGPRTIVLVHELGLSLESWDDIVGELSRGHRVLRYDLRGFGLSEKLRGSVTIEDEVEDLRALLDSLGIADPVTLVGGAVGGAIALRFAAAHPERVAAVMALSPAGDVAPASRAAYLARAARLERLGMRADVDATRNDTYPPELQAGHVDRLERFLSLQYAIRCPAWFVAVSKYKARPVESVKAMASAVARGHFEVLDTGPFVALQSPELLLPLLRTFLEAIR